MLTYRELEHGFRQLGLDPNKPAIAHASLQAFGEVRGGAQSLLGALLAQQPRLMMPTHTYKTMVIPEDGPSGNGTYYGTGKDLNAMAEFFTLDMPADPLMGVLPETLRKHPQAVRSDHPILSFAGVSVTDALEAQTLEEPLAPIRVLLEQDGWVLLLGVDHSVNTSIHYAEKMAGRKQFTRWALTAQAVVECPDFPGCSLGFEKAAPALTEITREVHIGPARVRALPLRDMTVIISGLIAEDPLALLCDDPSCERCAAVGESALTS